MRTVPPHLYISTACQHGIHTRCAQTCKFCAAPCACGCTHTEQDEQPLRDGLNRVIRAGSWEPDILTVEIMEFLRALPPSCPGEDPCG